MGLPPLVHFPGFAEPTPEEIEEAEDEGRRPFGTQLFPFRTMAMILSMISLVSISKLMVWLFKTNKLQKHHDIFKCIVNIPEDETQVTEQEEGETIGMTTNTDVKTYKSVEEVNGRVSINNGAELRKRKESLGKQVVGRQDSFIRPLEERPLTKEDLRRSFGSKQNSVDPENVTLEEKPVPTQRKVQPLRKGDRKESLKQIKQGIKEGVKEAKEVVKDLTEHLPDGHRGSIASVTERPRYKLLDKQTKQTEL